MVLCAFFRLAEKIGNGEKRKSELRLLRDLWKNACAHHRGWEYRTLKHESWVPVLRGTVEICEIFRIPSEYFEEYFDTLLQDEEKTVYETYSELERYIYGAYGTVALCIAYVIGVTEKRALIYVEDLGYAIGFTKLLRDFASDWKEKKKIYLPREELQSFGITEKDIDAQEVTEMIGRFIGFQLSRARAFYLSGDEGISLFEKDGRLFVSVFSAIYAAMLDKIESQGYNLFTGSTTLSRKEKFLTALEVWKYLRRASFV